MDFKSNTRSIALWIIIALFFVTVFNIYQSSFKRERLVVSLSDFITDVSHQKVQDVVLKEQELQATYKDGHVVSTYTPRGFNPIPLLVENHVNFRAAPLDTSSLTFFAILQILFPLILFGAALFFFSRQMHNSSGRALGFGRARAKRADPEKNTITFKDVEGVEEAKEDLKEIVEFLQHPERFHNIGGTIPKGVLLVGPPGTGKTLLAKAVSGEAKVPFFSISGSDFVEMFVGVGASRVRDLFNQAKQHAPCIVFIDEIDAVGRNRSVGLGGGHDEREQTLNQLLVEMDGFDPAEEVIVIAATNRSDVLDPALLRPGRFDRRILVDLPDLKGRESILKVHLKKISFSDQVSPLTIARGTPGFSGADLANLVNEAALRAARTHKKVVEPEDFELSRDKIIMGPERRSLVLGDHEKKLTAYHEAGHAVVAYHSKHSDPIHKVTIIPRGGALGMVVRFPEGDKVSVSKQRLMDDLAVAMGGRIGEELLLGPKFVTTGGASDFRMATQIARNMVLEWGMSDVLGPLSYSSPHGETFFSKQREYSDEVMHRIDSEIRKIIDTAYQRATSILTEYRQHLDLIAESLLENETLSGKEVHELLTHGLLKQKVPSVKKPRSVSTKSRKSTLVLTPQETI